jgi:hypothetical protein
MSRCKGKIREVLETSKEGIISQTVSPNEVKAIEPSLQGFQKQMETQDLAWRQTRVDMENMSRRSK